MLLLIIPAIAFIVVFICGCLDGEVGFGITAGLMCALIAFMVTFIVGLCVQGNPTYVDYSDTYEIHALVDNVAYEHMVSRNAYLVKHKVDDSLEYSFMYMVEGKGFAFKEVSAKDCYLNYTNDTPCVVRNHLRFESDFLEWGFGCLDDYEYIFYLPEGAEIINDYIIDFS